MPFHPGPFKGCYSVASSWLNQSRDDRKSKTRPRNKHQIIRRSKQSSVHDSQEEPRSERDVIRLRNPTEDKRAFRRMLTSADPLSQTSSLSPHPLDIGDHLRSRIICSQFGIISGWDHLLLTMCPFCSFVSFLLLLFCLLIILIFVQ